MSPDNVRATGVASEAETSKQDLLLFSIVFSAFDRTLLDFAKDISILKKLETLKGKVLSQFERCARKST